MPEMVAETPLLPTKPMLLQILGWGLLRPRNFSTCETQEIIAKGVNKEKAILLRIGCPPISLWRQWEIEID